MEKPIDTKAIRELLEINLSARVGTWLNICSNCGLCAESCLFYLANGKEPGMSPGYKLQATLVELYRRKGRVDRAFLERCREIVWTECTLCRRCSLYCPFGIDIAAALGIVRSICNSQGMAPEGLAMASENYLETGNQMGISREDFTNTCAWMAEETAAEIKGLRIPIDMHGASIMYTVSGREPMYYPQDLAMMAKIFTLAEEDWTMPGVGWDSTNFALLAGNGKLAGQVVKNMYDKALELGVQRIATTESGHAYSSAAFEGPYLAGCRDGKPPVPVVHSVRLFYEYLSEGRITIDPDKMIDEPVTYQDPCNVSRNGGLWREGREIIGYLARDFRDMSPCCEYNHCCGGGGGFTLMGPSYKCARMRAGKIKAEQIKATGAKIVIAPCHNCSDQIKELNREYSLGVKVLSFKEIISESVMVPEKFRMPHSIED